MPFQNGRHFLQIPGPTNVPDRILRALSRPTIDHRGPEFADLSLEILNGLKRIFHHHLAPPQHRPSLTPPRLDIDQLQRAHVHISVRAATV